MTSTKPLPSPAEVARVRWGRNELRRADEPDRVGLGVTAFVRVRLDRQDDHHLSIFEDAVASLPEVMECYLMTGDADYQLRVLVGDLREFEDFLRYKLTKIACVSQLTTSFALRPVVYKTAVPTHEQT